MSDTDRISKAEEAILTAVGYLVMRWNYAESFARQILRQYVQADSMRDPEHLRLSARPAIWIEQQLKSDALPRWTGTGRAYLEGLILAYSRAREHRNHVVHGVYMTFGPSGPYPAQALLYSVMPKDNKPQVPTHVTLADLRPIADHLHDLAVFARDVSVGFGANGDRALNSDGGPVLEDLPAILKPLEPCKFQTI
jgi:hypothetical protein